MKKITFYIFLSVVISLTPLLHAQFRVVLYHAHPGFDFNEQTFRSHVDFLYGNDYHTVTSRQFQDWYDHDEPLPIRPILLTFDDNYIDVYNIAYPVLAEKGFCAVNFAHTYYVGVSTGNDHCDWIEIQEMENNGVFITESHTRTHKSLSQLVTSGQIETARDEIEGSKAAIEDNMTSKTCLLIAYPYGAYNEQVMQMCDDAGYRSGFTTSQQPVFRNVTRRFEMGRYSVDGKSVDGFRQSIGYNDLPHDLPETGWCIDNIEVNFSRYSDDWEESAEPAGYFGKNYLRHPPDSSPRKIGRWAAYLPESGYYRVNAWWMADAENSDNVRYEINCGNTSIEKVVDQTVNGGMWNVLADLNIDKSIPVEIYIYSDENADVIADGVWFEALTTGITAWNMY